MPAAAEQTPPIDMRIRAGFGEQMTNGRTRVIYASGARGDTVRGDGQGGYMARGWYLVTSVGHPRGPFKTARHAEDAYDPADEAH